MGFLSLALYSLYFPSKYSLCLFVGLNGVPRGFLGRHQSEGSTTRGTSGLWKNHQALHSGDFSLLVNVFLGRGAGEAVVLPDHEGWPAGNPLVEERDGLGHLYGKEHFVGAE